VLFSGEEVLELITVCVVFSGDEFLEIQTLFFIYKKRRPSKNLCYSMEKNSSSYYTTITSSAAQWKKAWSR
jgi:hypothetical protein